ncbi:uncharacterized protein F5891DRAFT_1199564 [Suillus fuscotomentosus]|uniref:Uncharacterized protein n=1 Tax=Suillus fuscotomentosus TaxID=1912939 RepID=A0AAD4DRC9_9AGAM|nr:uncharacterized protein F5891DRAFT_1199564 [Suillus fuscotomentosus]KAG1887908.1 hypothetical protein F5891DRAFT_1199564 [Suillus fuscotomentosus]
MSLPDHCFVLLGWTGTIQSMFSFLFSGVCSPENSKQNEREPSERRIVEDPWCGLLRSRLVAYKHVFMSLSSVDKEPKATRSGNARLHGMNSVTIASIAYVATQVRFAISSSSVFSWTDTTTDSETFYHSLLDLFEDPDESKEVEELLTWWNRQVFPTSSAAKRSVSANSALSKIRLKRLATKQAAVSNTVSS